MRLTCELDNGESVEVASAIKRDVYGVRGLLVDALLSCCEELPDSIHALVVEQALREALSNFPGDNENYVRRYVLTRRLDSRTQVTARAGLISSSLQVGGPLALIAVFYATLDAHRNTRNRDTLHLLVHELSEESKRDLFQRAGSFPANPSFKAWFNRLLDRLDRDALGIACLFRCFGTLVIPRAIFARSREVSRRWGVDGEVCQDVRVITPVVHERPEFEAALQKLDRLGFTKSTVDVIRVNQRLSGMLSDREELEAWKVKAVQLLVHALPKHRGLEPEDYALQYDMMLPQFKHVSSYLAEPQVLSRLGQGPGPGLYETVEVCIAASCFHDAAWKDQAIDIAARLVQALEQGGHDPPSDITLLRARLSVRTRRLLLSRNCAVPHETPPVAFGSENARSDAFSADLALLKACESIRRNDLTSAHADLSSFRPLFTTALGSYQAERLVASRGIVYRYQGHFPEACEALSTVRDPGTEVLAHLSAVMCELGQYDRALARLYGWLRLTRWPDSKGAARIRLALANSYLFRGMRQVLLAQAWPATPDVQAMYQDLLSRAQLGWFDRIVASIGLAVAIHCGGQVQSAIHAWEEVGNLTREFQLPGGYYRTIVHASVCELELRHGNSTSTGLEATALGELLGPARQHYVAGLGTVWPEILGRWLM